MLGEPVRISAQLAYLTRSFLLDIKRMLRATLSLYLKPFLQILDIDFFREARLSDLIDYGTPHWKDKRQDGWFLRYMREITAFNHTALIQYSFLAAEKHKLLRELLDEDGADLQKISQRTSDLMAFLNAEFYGIVERNFDFLHEYFSRRGGVAPRICLKGNFRMNDSESVISIFRDAAVDYNSNTDIRNNTAFFSIWLKGRYYLENNLPAATLKGEYKNPRLDTDMIRKEFDEDRSSASRLNRSWDSFWKDYRPTEDRRSFYRSTLVVPLTIGSGDLTEAFEDTLARKIGSQKPERAILGFLCLDNYEAGYFDEERDVQVAHSIADILSVYVFNRVMYTDASKTFRNVRSMLREKDLNKARDVLSKLRDLSPRSIFDVTSDNELISVDEGLLDYVKPKKA
jgi:hypothetical protein